MISKGKPTLNRQLKNCLHQLQCINWISLLCSPPLAALKLGLLENINGFIPHLCKKLNPT